MSDEDEENLKIFAKELHAPVYKPRQYRRVVAAGKQSEYGADLVDMGKKYLKENDNYRYIVVVEDIFTRRIWLRATKNKDATTLWNAFEDVIKDGKPKTLWSDMEGGIYSTDFDAKLTANGITKFTTHSDFGVANVESANRVLRKWMGEMWSLNQNHKWVGLLPDLEKKWNEHVVKGLGMTPMEAWNHADQKALWKKQYGDAIPVGQLPDLKVGDKVRITKKKSKFAKAHEINWTPEWFFVDRIDDRYPTLYYLKSKDGEAVIGAFYRAELLKTAVPEVYLIEEVLETKMVRGKKMLKCRWFGWPEKWDSWVDESAVYKDWREERAVFNYDDLSDIDAP